MSFDDLPMRPITDPEWPAYWRTIVHAFHGDVRAEESDAERAAFEPERSLAVFDGQTPVATGGAYTRDLTVPGGIVPAAHVTMVSVMATHRRRGLLSRMMRRQLREVADAGREPVAALWASEEAIYGRYGYGPATYQVMIEADTREVRLPEPAPTGRVRFVDPEQAVEDLSQVYEQVRGQQPGFSSRPGPWWPVRLTDLESRRRGATERRCVLHETEDGVTGYALWRAKSEWDATGPQSEIRVEELVTADPVARLELWRFLFGIDLARKITCFAAPVDDPLTQRVDAPRRLGRRLENALYVRVVDVPAALAARRYAAPVDLVIDVTDELLPGNTGRWRLVGDTEKAHCEPTSEPADLTLGIRELGAVYLGGTQLGALAAAGLVQGRPEAIAAASAGFGWHVTPFAPEVF